ELGVFDALDDCTPNHDFCSPVGVQRVRPHILKIDGVRLVHGRGEFMGTEKKRQPDSGAPGVEAAKEASDAQTAVDKAMEAKAKLAALPVSGALDANACQTALNASLTVEKIQFRAGSAAIQPISTSVLDRLAGILKRCAGVKAEIGGHTDNVGREASNQALSERRAGAVAQYLRKAGVAADRVIAVGYGASKPIAPNDTEDGRAENRRIEFTVK
ncbi:MAG: OmpA family protein, partial [Methylocystis sp.]|nr:OmpA family protein [Methylocystis sp.]